MIDPNDLVVTLGNLALYDSLRGASYNPEQEALCFGAVPQSANAQEKPEPLQPQN